HHPRDSRRRSGQVEEQREDGDRVEPIAELRDRLPDEQEAEVAIGAKDRDVRVQMRRTIIIVAHSWSRAWDTTRSSTVSGREDWARCTARATHAPAALSRSRSCRKRSRTTPRGANACCAMPGLPPPSRIPTSRRCTKRA